MVFFLHDRLGMTMIWFALLLGIWGLWRYVRGLGVDSNYLGAVVIGEILILVQGALGLVLFFEGMRPGRLVHLLYGVAAALAFPAAYTYTQGGTDRRAMLIWSLVALFVFGCAVRATMVVGGL